MFPKTPSEAGPHVSLRVGCQSEETAWLACRGGWSIWGSLMATRVGTSLTSAHQEGLKDSRAGARQQGGMFQAPGEGWPSEASMVHTELGSVLQGGETVACGGVFSKRIICNQTKTHGESSLLPGLNPQ